MLALSRIVAAFAAGGTATAPAGQAERRRGFAPGLGRNECRAFTPCISSRSVPVRRNKPWQLRWSVDALKDFIEKFVSRRLFLWSRCNRQGPLGYAEGVFGLPHFYKNLTR